MHWNNDQYGDASTNEESFIIWPSLRGAICRHTHSILNQTFKHILLSLPGNLYLDGFLPLSLPRDLFITSGHNHTWSFNAVIYSKIITHIMFGHFSKMNCNDAFVYMLGIKFLQTMNWDSSLFQQCLQMPEQAHNKYLLNKWSNGWLDGWEVSGGSGPQYIDRKKLNLCQSYCHQ